MLQITCPFCQKQQLILIHTTLVTITCVQCAVVLKVTPLDNDVFEVGKWYAPVVQAPMYEDYGC